MHVKLSNAINKLRLLGSELSYIRTSEQSVICFDKKDIYKIPTDYYVELSNAMTLHVEGDQVITERYEYLHYNIREETGMGDRQQKCYILGENLIEKDELLQEIPGTIIEISGNYIVFRTDKRCYVYDTVKNKVVWKEDNTYIVCSHNGDILMKQYTEKKKYTLGFLRYIKNGKQTGKIEAEEISRYYMGTFLYNGKTYKGVIEMREYEEKLYDEKLHIIAEENPTHNRIKIIEKASILKAYEDLVKLNNMGEFISSLNNANIYQTHPNKFITSEDVNI